MSEGHDGYVCCVHVILVAAIGEDSLMMEAIDWMTSKMETDEYLPFNRNFIFCAQYLIAWETLPRHMDMEDTVFARITN